MGSWSDEHMITDGDVKTMVAVLAASDKARAEQLNRIEGSLGNITTQQSTALAAIQSRADTIYATKTDLQLITQDIASMKASAKPFQDTFWEIVKYIAIAVAGYLLLGKLNIGG